MRFKTQLALALLGLSTSLAMAQYVTTPAPSYPPALAQTVSAWTLLPGGSLRVYATTCSGPLGYGSALNEGIIRYSPLLYQWTISNPTGAVLTFHCIVNQQ